MSTDNARRTSPEVHGRRTRDEITVIESGDAPRTPLLDKSLAVLRIGMGLVFLWAFLDKMFGLRYSTGEGRSWLDGGSPTEGFLSNVHVGPMQSMLRSWAGDGWADWGFMLGLLAIGVALTAGIGLRLAAVGGSIMMALMWAAEWPPARVDSAGELTRSSHPFMDYHLVYALVVIVLAVAYAGHTWGLGRRWAALPMVRNNRWLV